MISPSFCKDMYEESMNVPCSKPVSFALELSEDNVLTGKESVSYVLGTWSLSMGPNCLSPLSGFGQTRSEPLINLPVGSP